ncbi:hypothetical protein ACFONG_14445 [Uliginosibacterium paludis]|uniref:Uncharacterized protein n=1 Tax=Uliginosibacterium paludis TaxID=1615952 RepID=A0ABV2CVP8_9RHOO
MNGDKHGVSRTHSLAASWSGFCHNPHVQTEFAALILALFAFAGALIGLHITPIVCAALAVILVCGDFVDWLISRRGH